MERFAGDRAIDFDEDAGGVAAEIAESIAEAVEEAREGRAACGRQSALRCSAA